ncbi:DUF159 family protein [Pseudoduganella sp. FT26W]|uniref:Abasic site processing protein n=1 Tax=Duganella aquatilis TaxID=2666082 RepID=A0A844DDQ4_9BURK|nr:SOS response-associated peptidase family protein [Duganella aquatilis]MRW86766.1 DUF159 family protein [Duganella aquatilis]
MCVNYRPPDTATLNANMGGLFGISEVWEREIWKDYSAPIVRRGANGQREGVLANYAMYPMEVQRREYEAKKAKALERGLPVPKPKWFDTMNARSEDLLMRPLYTPAWKRQQFCLVPATCFFEPCYETGTAVRWGIGMADMSMFAIAGLWREWAGKDGPVVAFTQLTINADEHPLMRRFHKPDDEKRSLVIVPQAEWDDWLECKDLDFARSFLRHYPADLMKSWAEPQALRTRTPATTSAPANTQLDLL